MNTSELIPTLSTLYSELVDGARTEGAFVLNGGDAGLLASLDALSASQASQSSAGGATVAAHADHLRYGISLLNRWAGGETNPWATADWKASWRVAAVDDAAWQEIRRALREEAQRWGEQMRIPRDVATIELNGVVASVAHIAYHLGAIRQISRETRGPREGS